MELNVLAWAGIAVVVLLALAGLYYLYLRCCGYRCLPPTTTDCPGGKPHHLVYVNDYELGELAKIAKHTGKPCHGIDSFPPAEWLPQAHRRYKHLVDVLKSHLNLVDMYIMMGREVPEVVLDRGMETEGELQALHNMLQREGLLPDNDMVSQIQGVAPVGTGLVTPDPLLMYTG